MPAGVLYLVSTPIGNLGDVTQRALEVLADVELVAAEDTRRSRTLLDRYNISARLVSLHEHNEGEQAPVLVERLRQGTTIALISDAGTPLVSDPGYRLVRLAIEAGIVVSPIPGASAVTAALSVSGLPPDRFSFEGFLPAKASARRAVLQSLASEPRTQVFFESSHRIVASLGDLAELYGDDRQAAVCRELTKQFETVLRGSLGEIVERVASEANQQKGEFVVVVAGHEAGADQQLAAGLDLARALLEHLSASQAAKVAARISGASRRDLYEQLIDA